MGTLIHKLKSFDELQAPRSSTAEADPEGRTTAPLFDVVILGFPFDEGCRRNGGRPGAQFGPDAFRQFVPAMGCVVNAEYDADLRHLKIADGGNVTGDTLEAAHANLREAVRRVMLSGAVPFVVGGSNDQSAPNGLAALDVVGSGNLAVVNIDAHLDVRPLTPEGLAHSGSPFRQLLEDGRLPGTQFVEFACQGNQCSAAHVDYVKEKGGSLYWWSEIRSTPVQTFQRLLDEGGGMTARQANDPDVPSRGLRRPNSAPRWFVSFDIDAITGADCPGVSCPASFGLGSDDALRMCHAAGVSSRVALVDVSEMNPIIEGYRTPRLVANMLYFFLLGMSRRLRSLPAHPKA